MITCVNCMDLDKMQKTITEYEEHFGARDEKTIVTPDTLKNCVECDFGLAQVLPNISAVVKALDPTYPSIEALKKAIGGEIKRKCYKALREG